MTSKGGPERSEGALDETRVQHRPETRLERVEERLTPEVTTREAGRLQIRRRVVEEPDEIELTLRHDELELDRRRVDRVLAPDERPVSVRGDTTVVLVIEERLEVRKVPWVVEEVHLRRRLVTEQQTVSDTLRKERVEIETQGDVEMKHR